MDVTICHNGFVVRMITNEDVFDEDGDPLPDIIDWIPEPWRNWIPPDMVRCHHPQIRAEEDIFCIICLMKLF